MHWYLHSLPAISNMALERAWLDLAHAICNAGVSGGIVAKVHNGQALLRSAELCCALHGSAGCLRALADACAQYLQDRTQLQIACGLGMIMHM